VEFFGDSGVSDVAVALHLERRLAQRLLDLVGDALLVTGDTRDVDQRGRERDRVVRQVQGHAGMVSVPAACAFPRLAA